MTAPTTDYRALAAERAHPAGQDLATYTRAQVHAGLAQVEATDRLTDVLREILAFAKAEADGDAPDDEPIDPGFRADLAAALSQDRQ